MVSLPEASLSLASGFGVPLGLSLISALKSMSPFHTLLPLTLGTAVSRSPFRPVQSKILSVRAHTRPALPLSTLPHTRAPPRVPQEAHGHGTLLMRDPAKELPPGAMKAVSGHSREQELDFQGTTRAWLGLCTRPQVYPVNSIKLRASRQISLEYWERWTPGPHQPRWNPLDLTLAAAEAFFEDFSKGPFLAFAHHSFLAFETSHFLIFPGQRGTTSLPPSLATLPPSPPIFPFWGPASAYLVWWWESGYSLLGSRREASELRL